MAEQMVKCIDCKVDIDASDAQCVINGLPWRQPVSNDDATDEVFRCKNCDIVRTKMLHFFVHQPNSLDDMFQFMLSIPELNTQIKDHLSTFEFMHSLSDVDDELADKLKAIRSLRRHRGEFHQKSYFEEKNKDSPDILRDLLENAPQWVHPDTKETLWRETKISSSESYVNEEIKALETQCIREEKVKQPKQPRSARTAVKDENAGDEDGHKKLKLGDKIKLNQNMEVLKKRSATLQAFMEEAEKPEVSET